MVLVMLARVLSGMKSASMMHTPGEIMVASKGVLVSLLICAKKSGMPLRSPMRMAPTKAAIKNASGV